MKCAVCNREAFENNYCRLHMRAYESVVKTYEEWTKALEISWEEYLREITKNPLTGEWTKEVAEHLIRSGEK